MSQLKELSADSFVTEYKGKTTQLITISNASGSKVELTNYGARTISIIVPDKDGNLTDVVLGFDSIQKYFDAQEQYHGAIIGRYANRVAEGKFTLDGKEYTLFNKNGYSLHGGPDGFHNQVWDVIAQTPNSVTFEYTSIDGEEGYPGNLTVKVTYLLTDNNEVKIDFEATTDQKTVLNVTNHAYFNLHGEGNGDVLDHHITIPSSHFLPTNEMQLPLTATPVENTVFNFKNGGVIGENMDMSDPQLEIAKGYDHSFVVEQPTEDVIASAYSEKTGIELSVYTTEPSVHLYIGNWLGGVDVGKSGDTHGAFSAFCFETQHFANTPNRPDFPSAVLDKGEVFKSTSIFKFSIKK